MSIQTLLVPAMVMAEGMVMKMLSVMLAAEPLSAGLLQICLYCAENFVSL
jgi:hypothetical protein